MVAWRFKYYMNDIQWKFCSYVLIQENEINIWKVTKILLLGQMSLSLNSLRPSDAYMH